MTRFKIDAIRVYGSIGQDMTGERTFNKGCTVALFRKGWFFWHQLDSFRSLQEARDALALIRDLPEYS